MSLLFDSHCHIEGEVFGDLAEVISNSKEKLAGLVCSGVDPAVFQKVIDLSNEYEGFVYASLGIHPEYANKFDNQQVESAIDKIRNNQNAIVGIGEVGLDYFWHDDQEVREKQKELFKKFIRLARELSKPLVVHIRTGKDKENSAYEDAFEILESEGANKVLLHMFGVRKLLDRAMSNGWYISTNAIVQSSKEHKRTIKAVPLDRLLLETDSPQIVPEPLKSEGVKRNEPVFVEYVARRVAQIREIDFEEVCSQTTQNAKEFFRL